MISMLEAALEYAQEGFPVFPCGFDKQPKVEGGLYAASTDPAQIKKWWATWPNANIGFSPGDRNWMVIDTDPGSDLRVLAEKIGGLPDTLLSQTTPRGGRHLFYALDLKDPKVRNSASKLAPHVDVRSFGGYVLLAPSKTEAGEYRWDGDWRAIPALRTTGMLTAAESAADRDKGHDTWIIEPDLPENVAACIDWLKTKAQIAIMGQGGESVAYRTAAMCKSYGLSAETASELMWEHWNPRNQPPWDAENEGHHFDQKIINGYNYNTSPPGNVTKAYREAKAKELFKPVALAKLSEDSDGSEWTAGRFRFTDRAGLDFIKPATWLIPGLIPENSFGLLFGQPGTFKTFVALDMALCVAVEPDWPQELNWKVDPAKRGKVLYALGEGRSKFKDRVRIWEHTHNKDKPVSNFVLGDPVPGVQEELTPFIDGALAASPEGYRLVIIDTIGRSMQGFNENSQEHASKFTHLVEQLQRRLNCAVLALHHSGHGDKSRGKGNMEFMGAPDVLLGLERKDKSFSIQLGTFKQKDDEELPPISLTLREIKLPNAKSLVVETPSLKSDAAPTSTADLFTSTASKKKNDPTRNDEGTVTNIIANAILETLKNNPLTEYSDRKLASILACREDIEVSSSRIRQNHLRAIREGKNHPVRAMYNAPKERWRFVTL